MDLNWLWVVPILGVLIVVHELGHFLTAIWLNIKVLEFGIGFPPRLFAIRRGGIDYSLNLLPIGGFVKIEGEDGSSDDPRAFSRAPAWKRIIVLAAGSFMNLLLALIIFAGLSIAGTPEVDAPLTGVSEVRPGYPADVGGIKPGDRIVSIAGKPVNSSEEIRALSQANQGKPTTFVVERDNRQVTLTITPQGDPPLGVNLTYWVPVARVEEVRTNSPADRAGFRPGDRIVEVNGIQVDSLPEASYLLGSLLKPDNQATTANVVVERNGQRVPLVVDVAQARERRSYGIGFELPYRIVHYSPVDAMGRALENTWMVLSSVPRGIAQAIAGRAEGPGVTGPVGIGQLTGEVAQEGGINGLLNLTALLGISLFMINLLPLPALDGGRLLFVFIELLRGGRRIAPEKEGLVHVAGMVVLLTLMAIVTFFDIARLLQGTPLLP
jgi:regulator of sigma E protease